MGNTADISALALFSWYEWVMFRDTVATYPDDKMVLGRDLGPAIDIGPAMTRKILKANGQVVYRSTVRSLTPDEMSDETMKREREKFTESVNKALGDAFKYEDFVNDPELEDLGTPIYEPYSDGEMTMDFVLFRILMRPTTIRMINMSELKYPADRRQNDDGHRSRSQAVLGWNAPWEGECQPDPRYTYVRGRISARRKD
ncbi:Reverse transcriptase (RNA-dependent DNA polymerase) [Fragilaria crotonensis]|nr:Reverse transcriptase (RNA-dependent DNA polymerase) [Fragilaria crotonensis]